MRKIILALAASSLAISGCASVSTIQRESVKYTMLVETATGRGTGFPVSEHCVATAGHVLSADTKEVVVTDSEKNKHKFSVKYYSEDSPDIGIVCAYDISMRPVKLARKEPKAYTPVYAIGNPLDYSNILTEGKYQGNNVVTSQLAPGNSGGPVFDSRGRVIGIADAIGLYSMNGNILGFPHLGVIVPVSELKKVMQQLHDNGVRL